MITAFLIIIAIQKFLERIFGKDCLTLAEGTEMNEETAFAAIQELVNSIHCGNRHQ